LEDLHDTTLLDGHGSYPKHTRRLSDKLLLAFHQACDQQDNLVASQLLGILESMLTSRPHKIEISRRRSLNSLVAAHERMWQIKHPQADVV
jgi:hypothetical protein